MTKLIGIISGKGGVGKTTCALNLAVAMSNFGRHVVVVDGNLSTPNIGLSLGVPRFRINLNDVLKGKEEMSRTAYRHMSGIMVIPSDIRYNVASYDLSMLKDKIKDLMGRTEVVLVDSAGGINEESKGVIDAVDDVLVITTPDMNSITDALKSIHFAQENGANVLGVVINRKRGDHHEVSVANVETILSKPVIGEISEDDIIRESLSMKQPAAYVCPECDASKDFRILASRIIGQDYKERAGSVEELKLSKEDFFAR